MFDNKSHNMKHSKHTGFLFVNTKPVLLNRGLSVIERSTFKQSESQYVACDCSFWEKLNICMLPIKSNL